MSGPAPAALAPAGWRPFPFREFILKIAGRCDLACDYCYMFAMADHSWVSQPRFMSEEVLHRACRVIAAHVRRHRISNPRVILHGGEPLLAGGPALARMAGVIRAALPAPTGVSISVQTNGVRLDEPALDHLVQAGIRVSVSLDGEARHHDRHRVRPSGDGSFAAVTRAVRLLGQPQFRKNFAGLLCVVDLRNDPAEVYEALARFNPPVIDFLLPHGNWSNPPPGLGGDAGTPYGDWLSRAFLRWYDGSAAGRPEVRLFREIITLLLGGRSRTEQVGLSPAAMVVFNVDGGIEQVDSLRSVYHGAASTAMSVFTHDLDDALRHPAIAARQIGAAALSGQCRRCPVMPVCGGGHYPHRFRQGSGFRNPSVYCHDLSALIRLIRDRVQRDIDVLRRAAA